MQYWENLRQNPALSKGWGKYNFLGKNISFPSFPLKKVGNSWSFFYPAIKYKTLSLEKI